MSNTVMTAKNSFAEGLVMDFAPDNTLATTLTSALNATLLTFNGNEMSLLNDMGNGRVETAYLPEGYVPVGTCEFGDIIYIVSYNPLINRSLIGCFPSPERNISSDELGGLKNNLKASDFLEISNDLPTGRLVASSCKKIMYEKELNPGDKYIVSSSTLEMDGNTFSDYGNTSNIYGRFPKLLKIHIIAIEDSGKINYLDSTVRWYDNFYIAPFKNDSTGLPDLDSYRSLISSGYSIFLSKVSGKLALLIELEKINSFSCTYDIYSDAKLTRSIDPLTYKNYKVYWSINWGSEDSNINPKYLVLTKSEWSGKNPTNAGKYFAYTEKDGIYNINYAQGTLADIPSKLVPFYNHEGLVNPTYWYTEIDRLYLPETYPGTFNDFINNGSYLAIEKKIISDIIKKGSVYEDTALSKLTVCRDESGKPIPGLYYINAHHILENKYYTAKNLGTYKEIEAIELPDDIVNNYFKSLTYKLFDTFNIPFSQTTQSGILYPDISNLIYHYNITPAMPYGLLEEFTLDGYIDFSKIGTGEIKPTNWKYYNTENISTLTLGLEVYPETNKGVAEIAIDFYDNLGTAATYRIMNKNSYSGLFTEYIPLNGSASNYKLTAIDSSNIPIYHCGLLADLNTDTDLVYREESNNYKVIKKDDEYKYTDNTGTEKSITTLTDIYKNDAGILYSNIVYLAKITVKYCSLDALGNFNTDNTRDFKVFYRWMWTNTMFNEYYYTVSDFDKLKAILDLDISAQYNSTSKWLKYSGVYEPKSILENNLSATVQAINLDKLADADGNIDTKVIVGLQNAYNTFNIAEKVGEVNYLNLFELNVVLGKSYIDNIPEKPEIESIYPKTLEYKESVYPIYDPIPNIKYNEKDNYGILPLEETSDTLLKLLKVTDTGIGKELWDDSYQNYKNRYSLNFKDSIITEVSANKFLYLDINGEVVELPNYREYKTTLNNVDLLFSFTGIHFSKYYKECTTEKVYLETLVPLVNTLNDLKQFGMGIKNEAACFTQLLAIGTGQMWKDSTPGKGRRALSYVATYSLPETGAYFNTNNITYRAEAWWVVEKDSDDYANAIFGVMKNSAVNEKCRWWSGTIKESATEYLRDQLFSDIGLVLYCAGNRAEDPINITEDAGRSPITKNSNYAKRLPELNGSYLPRFDTFQSAENKSVEYVLGIAMKDINGEIHILNNIFKTKMNLYGLVSLEVRTENNSIVGTSSFIGNILLSILSNLYIKSPDKSLIPILKIVNIISLQNNKSSFTKDIVYTVKPTATDHNKLLLMRGIHFSDYIEKVKKYVVSNIPIEYSNVNFLILNVQKNIPILFMFDYTLPIKTTTLLGNTAIRLAKDNYYTLISDIPNTNELYTVDLNTTDLLIRPASTVSGFGIEKVKEDKDTGYLVYEYNDLIHNNDKFNLIFTLKDGHLRLSNTVYNSSELMCVRRVGSYAETGVAGIAKKEYITDFLKYT